jgi:hypothetical protein
VRSPYCLIILLLLLPLPLPLLLLLLRDSMLSFSVVFLRTKSCFHDGHCWGPCGHETNWRTLDVHCTKTCPSAMFAITANGICKFWTSV